uniref:Uncharacterized protein n=1 Tax=Rhizophora mucronata TaxID=61149 RepID=A0A2P2R150_RHIMU
MMVVFSTLFSPHYCFIFLLLSALEVVITVTSCQYSYQSVS